MGRRKHSNRRSRRKRSSLFGTSFLPVIFFVFSITIAIKAFRKTRRRRIIRIPISATSSSQPVSWFVQPGSMSESAPDGSVKATIPDGPIPFPQLRTDTETERATVGSSWIPSFAKGLLNALPLHWMMDSAPADDEEMGTSIFKAKRKGGWIGCERPHHLVCKGVYRAIKATNAIRVVDTQCEHNAGWLPHIIHKLREEFRMVTLICIGKKASGYGDIDVTYMAMDILTGRFPNNTDMIVAYKLFQRDTLIAAMKFMKNVKRSGTVDLLVTESYVEGDNVIRDGVLRMNTGIAPFWFPRSVFEYENEGENSEREAMIIVAVRTAELFEESNTPTMTELVDPRRRVVEER